MPNAREDVAALESLYDVHGASCYRLAHRMVKDERLACGIVREVFVAVWTRETEFEPSRGSVQTWLLRATHRSAVLALRRQRQLRSGGDFSAEIFAAQPRIGTVQRYMLELAYFGGYTGGEIATFTDTAPSTIKNLTTEAMRQLAVTSGSRQYSHAAKEK